MSIHCAKPSLELQDITLLNCVGGFKTDPLCETKWKGGEVLGERVEGGRGAFYTRSCKSMIASNQCMPENKFLLI